MEVGIAIGETHRFELREALLIYTESRNGAFITRHVGDHRNWLEPTSTGRPLYGQVASPRADL
jgi:hypothetical protein